MARTLATDAYLSGDVDTGFIERRASELLPAPEPPAAARQAAARSLLAANPNDPWTALIGFRSNAEPDLTVPLRIAETDSIVTLDGAPSAANVACVEGEQVVFCQGAAWPYSRTQNRFGADAQVPNGGATASPMPGRVVSVEVVEGDRVLKGAKLVVVEAMKMEFALVAPFDGVVAELRARLGDQVSEGTLLVRIDQREG